MLDLSQCSNLTPKDVQSLATLYREENGVQWWSNANVHYLIYLGRVYVQCGFWGQTCFNYLAHGRAVYDINGPDYRQIDDQGDWQPWLPKKREDLGT